VQASDTARLLLCAEWCCCHREVPGSRICRYDAESLQIPHDVKPLQWDRDQLNCPVRYEYHCGYSRQSRQSRQSECRMLHHDRQRDACDGPQHRQHTNAEGVSFCTAIGGAVIAQPFMVSTDLCKTPETGEWIKTSSQ
jgi:hypothetical protein